ncbi:MAG: HK97-gp10 family putative phage morphogenesis protein [Croceibacterium sp.]
MSETIKLTGFKELHDSLGNLKKTTERALLRRVAVKALEPIAERARQLVPVDKGNLRDSIVVGTNINSGARRAARKDPVQGVRVFCGTANRNAVPGEFGSARSPAQPFMRPAWDGGKDRVLESVQRDLKTEIEKAAARAAKRGK